LGDEGPGGPRCTDEEIVEALNIGFSTIVRVRRRFVTESLELAIHPRPLPPRPDKVKIQGDVEQHLIRLACSDPPAGRCCWTLELLADQLIALAAPEGLPRDRPAALKTTSSPGSCDSVPSPPRPTRISSGIWRTCFGVPTPYDPRHPVVCLTRRKQLIGEVAIRYPPRRGAARIDYEYGAGT
jgi:hypothetical protein